MFQDVSTLLNYTCPNVTWVSHLSIRCVFAGVDLPVPATLNVTVTIGNQSSDFTTETVFRSGILNDPPIAFPLNISTFEEQSVILQFEGYDTDTGDFVTMYILQNPGNGSLYQLTNSGERGPMIDTIFGSIPVTHSSFRVLYIPFKDFNGNDSFTFKARDIYNADSSIETAKINVISVPDPPIPQNVVYQLDEDTEFSFTLDVVDPDTPKLEQTVILLSLPQKGSLFSLNGTSWDQITTVPLYFTQNTTLKYHPLSNFYGSDSFQFMANDGQFNSTVNGTILFLVNPINDIPLLNTTSLNITVYEDTETTFEFVISDIDVADKLTVKITNLRINGSIYFIDAERGLKTLLGEGSEVRGPPYKVLYVPSLNYFSSTLDDYQHFNVTYTDNINNEYLTYQIIFPVLPVNDAPSISCLQPQIDLPLEFLVGVSSNHSFQFQHEDVDNSNLTFVLTTQPGRGIIRDQNGRELHSGDSFYNAKLTFEGNHSGGGYPYSNFTVHAIDGEGATSNNCTFSFTFSCPPGLYNNIFGNGPGEICEPCPQGAVCSVDGKVPPRPQYGWWRSEDNATFLACFPVSCNLTAS
ncbi:hypothetical protein BKA69DRAFT_205446 [Paraphysoderma sedebokerense]|nr:hypothetical protein BKA69DRAFT_205446 [Paraphysoderma sedebokerense]